MAKFLRIIEWEKYQHYKDRNPPWIKLHRELLTSNTWVELDDASRLLALVCMLLAADTDNKIPLDGTFIQRRAYMKKRPDVRPLVAVGFAEIVDDAALAQTASTVIADASDLHHIARPETETETYIQEEPKTLTQLPLSDCEAIYECYPRKIGKASAIKAVQRALGRLVKGEYQNKKLLLVEAVAGLKNRTLMFADSAAGKKANYTPHPATWFNRSSYLDDPKEWQDDEQQVVSKSTTRAQSNADAIRAGLGIGGDASGLRNDAGPGSASGGDEDLGPDVWERKAGEVEVGLRGTSPVVKVLSKASGHY